MIVKLSKYAKPILVYQTLPDSNLVPRFSDEKMTEVMSRIVNKYSITHAQAVHVNLDPSNVLMEALYMLITCVITLLTVQMGQMNIIALVRKSSIE